VARAPFGDDLKPVALRYVEHRDHRLVDGIRNRIEFGSRAAFEQIDLHQRHVNTPLAA
jgi:hypothetical protein